MVPRPRPGVRYAAPTAERMDADDTTSPDGGTELERARAELASARAALFVESRRRAAVEQARDQLAAQAATLAAGCDGLTSRIDELMRWVEQAKTGSERLAERLREEQALRRALEAERDDLRARLATATPRNACDDEDPEVR